MIASKYNMKPQDILVLLKIIALDNKEWQQLTLAQELNMSQSEISQSLQRSKYAQLVDFSGKKVNKVAFYEFLIHGLSYVFPQRPAAVVRGIATAHSAAPINEMIQATEAYVWPYAKGNTRGQAVIPLYSSAIEASLKDAALHELLAMTDVLRVGSTREKEIARVELKKRILNE
ncbi:hypothetical protein [Flavobacterium eburneipallidum]|uniref:hypothetical protein n=1 Tax=Flavobacterium eburneipallidum TaxID=3003263 RepID=UPI0024828BD1|nr:hypothetical protein [Flavobacterium eburneipallidum]